MYRANYTAFGEQSDFKINLLQLSSFTNLLIIRQHTTRDMCYPGSVKQKESAMTIWTTCQQKAIRCTLHSHGRSQNPCAGHHCQVNKFKYCLMQHAGKETFGLTCVAIPAWSQPGFHRVSSPRIRCLSQAHNKDRKKKKKWKGTSKP